VIEYATALVPPPSAVPPVDGTRVPKVALHDAADVGDTRKNPVDASPLGVPVPFNSAEVLVTAVAGDVVADGTAACAAACTNSTRATTKSRADVVATDIPSLDPRSQALSSTAGAAVDDA